MISWIVLLEMPAMQYLEKFGVVAVDTNNGFNADLHQAVGIDPNAKANEIGTVLQKGYTLNSRLLRPAMVMVGA
jgi:molecular chaperone GrpE